MSAAAEPAKPFSLSLSTKSKTPSVGPKNPKKRLHSSLGEFSDEDHDEPNGKIQAVSSFDQSAGGAIVKDATKEQKGPLVIPMQKNRDWRDATQKRGKNLLPKEEQERRNGTVPNGEQEEPDEEEKPKYGLNVRTAGHQLGHDSDTQMQDTEEEKPQTADEEAMDALLGKRKAPTLVIERPEESNYGLDIGSGPEAPSLADYEAMPIEEFGTALLRGMSWKEGDAIGRKKDKVVKPRILERRTAGLGLGAKEVPEGLEEPGAWGKGAKNTKKIDRTYLPLVRKNARTGETLTDAELKARQEQQVMVIDESDDRRKDDGSRRSHRDHRERDRDRERDSERRRRHRSRSSSRDYDARREKHRRSSRDRDYDSDKEYRRRKERRDTDRDYDRRDADSRREERHQREKYRERREHRRDRHDDDYERRRDRDPRKRRERG